MTELYRPLEEETFEGIPQQEIDENELDISADEFNENDIIIIKSGTASGKTRNTAKISPKLIGDKYKLLSIVNLRTLADEQLNTFSKIKILDYRDDLENFNESRSGKKSGFSKNRKLISSTTLVLILACYL
jgi:hypothetical protein